MSISSTLNRVNQNGNGVTVNVPIPFAFQSTTDLVVVETIIATGVQTTKTITTHYAVTGTQDILGFYPNGGTVVAVTAFPSTVRWTVYRDPAKTQTLDLTENSSLPAESVEAALDRQTMISQRNADLAVRTMRQPDGDETTIAEMPSKVDRASKFAAWDSNGDPIAAAGTSANLTPVSSFINTMLDDISAASARSTLGFPAIAAKGDSIHGTAANTLGLLAAGSNGDIEVSDSDQTSGFIRQQLRPVCLSPNFMFAVDQLANSATSVADDNYGHDHWYALTQNASVQVSTQTLQENGMPTNARLTQNQATPQRMGYACIIEASEAKKLRGRTLTFNPRVRTSTGQFVMCAMVEWTGTSDVVISDIVNDWTLTDFADGPTRFFVDANLIPLANNGSTPAANTWGEFSVTATVGSSCNNLILFVWMFGVAAQSVTLDIGKARLADGTYKGDVHIPTFHETLLYASRFYQKSFNYAVAPAQNAGLGTGEVHWYAIVAGALANNSPPIRYITRMRTNATLTFYNPAAANGQVRNLSDSSDLSGTDYIANSTCDSGFNITATGTAGTAVAESLAVHWTASARL